MEDKLLTEAAWTGPGVLGRFAKKAGGAFELAACANDVSQQSTVCLRPGRTTVPVCLVGRGGF